MIKPYFAKTNDNILDRNFQELTRVFASLSDTATARPLISASLAAGDNSITPNVASPLGRIIVFQDAAASLFDKGLINGKWVINASAPCNVKLTFF